MWHQAQWGTFCRHWPRPVWLALKTHWARLVSNKLGKLRPRVVVGTRRERLWCRVGSGRSQGWPCGPRENAGVTGRSSCESAEETHPQKGTWNNNHNQKKKKESERERENESKRERESARERVRERAIGKQMCQKWAMPLGGAGTVCGVSQVWLSRCFCKLLPFSWYAWETLVSVCSIV